MRQIKKKIAENYLDKIPVFSSEYTWKQDEKGLVTIYVENRGIFHKATRRFLRKPQTSQIHLDEIGSFIIPLMDGTRSIYSISLLLRKQFGTTCEPLYERLLTYLITLTRCGFIFMQ